MKLHFINVTTVFHEIFFVYFSYSVCAEKIHTACGDMATLFPGVSYSLKSVPKKTYRMSSDIPVNMLQLYDVHNKTRQETRHYAVLLFSK